MFIFNIFLTSLLSINYKNYYELYPFNGANLFICLHTTLITFNIFPAHLGLSK